MRNNGQKEFGFFFEKCAIEASSEVNTQLELFKRDFSGEKRL